MKLTRFFNTLSAQGHNIAFCDAAASETVTAGLDVMPLQPMDGLQARMLQARMFLYDKRTD